LQEEYVSVDVTDRERKDTQKEEALEDSAEDEHEWK